MVPEIHPIVKLGIYGVHCKRAFVNRGIIRLLDLLRDVPPRVAELGEARADEAPVRTLRRGLAVLCKVCPEVYHEGGGGLVRLVVGIQPAVGECVRREEVQVVVLVADAESQSLVDAERLQGNLKRDLDWSLPKHVSEGVGRHVVEVVVVDRGDRGPLQSRRELPVRESLIGEEIGVLLECCGAMLVMLQMMSKVGERMHELCTQQSCHSQVRTEIKEFFGLHMYVSSVPVWNDGAPAMS